jgi:RNA polymerase sigma-70 factor (ECF subfamily)
MESRLPGPDRERAPLPRSARERDLAARPTRANGQPAFGCYLQEAQAPVFRAHGMIVLTLAGDRISAITRFVDNSNLPRFGLPRMLAD